MNENSLKDVKLNIHYPRDGEYDYFVKLSIINLDKEFEKDMSNNQAFIIDCKQPLQKSLKSDSSIFSTKFGRQLGDEDAFSHRYKCKCGSLQGAFRAVDGYPDFYCPYCGEKVKLVGDDFTYFGYIHLHEQYHVISPAMYVELISLIGKDNLENILEPAVELDADGKPMSQYDRKIFKRKNARRYKKKGKVDSTYENIGMMGFYEKFDEILAYFLKKKKNKKEVYDLIMAHRDCVFTHSIPVYTTQLRIAKVEGKRFTFEKNNATFNILSSLGAQLNNDELSIYRNEKLQNQLLWDMQVKLSELSDEIIRILADKRGVMRSTISGRTAFSERSIIVPDSSLRSDEVSMPYIGLTLMLEQVLINIIQSSYNITYAEAYKKWYYATLKMDQRVLDILNNLIKMDKIHVLINRNPTIHYESIVWKRVVKINTDSAVLGLDPYVLKGLNADEFYGLCA
jgi:DNA-directed RNA polymerase beta' subunit